MWWGVLSVAGVMGRVCLGCVFLTAALPKLRHLEIFAAVLQNYRIVPQAVAQPASKVLPWVELLVGALLITQLVAPWAALAGIILLAMFAAAMAVNLRRGRAFIDCGCHQSTLRQTLRWALVWRNLGLAGLLAPSLAPGAPITIAHAAIGASAGLGGYLIYLMHNAIAALPTADRSLA